MTTAKNTTPRTFTGRGRRRTTRFSVKFADRAAKWIICTGGIGVTIAFATIVFFLISVVVPLFKAPKVEEKVTASLPALAGGDPARPPRILDIGLEETLATLWILDGDGNLLTYRTSGGEIISRQKLTDGSISAFCNAHGFLAVGLNDGTARVGRITQEVGFLPPDKIPDAAESLRAGETIAYEGAVAEMTPAGQLRTMKTVFELSEPISFGANPSPIRLIDYVREDNFEKLAVQREDGTLFLSTISKKKNMLTGAVKRSVDTVELPRPARGDSAPVALHLGTGGERVIVIYSDGLAVLYDARTPAATKVADEKDLLPKPGASVARTRMLLGNYTLIVADASGSVSGWFPVTEEINGEDRTRLVEAHELRSQGAPVTDIAISSRDRQFVTADAKGVAVLRHMTSNTTQAEVKTADGASLAQVDIAPKNDAIALLDTNFKLALHSLDNPHADGSLSAMFMPLHYEGYRKADFIYQSSAGTQDAELKISLVPLIFGTLKATFYALLFAVPIAILAAIYTSEFMQARLRAVIKPTVELMASLPSVVLGYIGALVIAQWVEGALAGVLLALVAIPVGIVMFGFLWQMLPPAKAAAMPASAKFAVMGAVVAGCWLVALKAGPALERGIFGGSIQSWLDGRGSAVPGWAIVLTPLVAVGLVLGFNLYVKPHLAIYRGARSRLFVGAVELGRLIVLAGASVAVACFVGWVLAALGLDLRGSVVGPYVQRNSLMVGLMMGFAIIPIIYTVSEDALSSVPSSLRSASLGAGATPWQTAVRVVLPVATSGIFSACMIGFGRAAGETMIVLMLSGRTPILELNIFNGLSALSANIATEMPEAPVNSTHFRVLFMSTLVLFLMTFFVNTLAEIVRTRFRRRAYQL